MATYLQHILASLLLLTLVAGPLLPAPPLKMEKKPAVALNPVLGMHTRLTDEVEKGNIDHTIDMVGDMGAAWIVEYFPWAYIEPEKGKYDWTHADLVVHSAASRGLKVIARLDMVPDWARPPGTPSRYLDEERYGDYARFVGAFALRYRGAVKGIVVWNEPNLSFEWGYRPVDPASYTRMLKAVYRPIKAADKKMAVIAAGLATTLETGEWGMTDLSYLQGMYDAGAKPYFDKLAVHAYGWRSPPDDPPSPDVVNFARTELLRQIMVSNGDEGKTIVVTESGWNDHPRWTKAVQPAQRIQYSLRALEKVESEWPWAESISFWSFRLPKPARNYNDYYTFVTVGFMPKPIYDAFRQRAAGRAPTSPQPAEGRG